MSDIPFGFDLEKFVRLGLMEKAPLLAAALVYARDTGVRLVPHDDEDSRGSAYLHHRHISLKHAPATAEDYETVGHEIKHISQADNNALSGAWSKFEHDMVQSLRSGVYQMDRQYVLPSAANAALIRIVAEMDSEVYGRAVFHEIEAIATGDASRRMTQDGLHEAHDQLLNSDYPEMWVSQELEQMVEVVRTMHAMQEKFGVLPSVKWAPVTLEGLQVMTDSFWDKAGLKSIFATPEGQVFMKDLRPELVAMPEFSALMEEFQDLMSGNGSDPAPQGGKPAAG